MKSMSDLTTLQRQALIATATRALSTLDRLAELSRRIGEIVNVERRA